MLIHFAVKSEDGHVRFLVPCGSCGVCRVQRSNLWALRCMHELESWDNKAVFVTLTYDEEHLPEDKSLHKEDLQKFWKRLRKNLGPNRKIKYFACGEYGSRFLRCHFHSIIFGLDAFDLRDKEIFKKSWSNCQWGMLSHYYEPVTYLNARYITKYIWDSKSKAKEYDALGLQQPFMVCSKGFGSSFVEKNKEKIIEDGFILYNGVKYNVPRYYRELLGLEFQHQYQKNAIAIQKKHKENFMFQNKDNQIYIDLYGNLETAYGIKQRESAEQKNLNIYRQSQLSKNKEKF